MLSNESDNDKIWESMNNAVKVWGGKDIYRDRDNATIHFTTRKDSEQMTLKYIDGHGFLLTPETRSSWRKKDFMQQY